MSEARQSPPSARPALSVAVAGLWHLGTVTAACIASRAIDTLGYDSNAGTIDALKQGQPPLYEPGLAELVKEGIDRGHLRFTADPRDLGRADILWAAWDTPVDDEDRADVDGVVDELSGLFPHLREDCLILVSSQLPAGTARRLERRYAEVVPRGKATFACSPENLRLGKAIEAFTKPERVIVGVRSEADADKIRALFAPFEVRLEFMRVESAEMTKHALNAFLATSVAFMNELSRLAEALGADAREVERGLKTEGRIGPRAYLRPGGAYAGGTLARDIAYLIAHGDRAGDSTPLLRGVRGSNDSHKDWAFNALVRALGDVAGKRIAILGLTYKAGTDTLRRSSAVELAERLSQAGAEPVGFDPAVKSLPASLNGALRLAATAPEALEGAAAAVVATEWPEFRALTPDDFVRHLSPPVLVFDAGGFLAARLEDDGRIRYHIVGKTA